MRACWKSNERCNRSRFSMLRRVRASRTSSRRSPTRSPASAFFGALALLRALLLLSGSLALGVALLRVDDPRGLVLARRRAVVRPRAHCPGAVHARWPVGVPVDLPLRLSTTIWLVLMSGTLRASAVLRLVPARATRLSTRTARTGFTLGPPAGPCMPGCPPAPGLPPCSWP